MIANLRWLKCVATVTIALGVVGCGLFPCRKCRKASTPCCETIEFAGGTANTIVLSPGEELVDVPESSSEKLHRMHPPLDLSQSEPSLPEPEPIPPPRDATSARTPSLHLTPTPDKTAAKPETAPDKLALPERPIKEMKKPGSLSLDVRAKDAVVAVGKDIVFEILVENTGEQAIASAAITATFSSNLRPRLIDPENSGTVAGNKIVFAPITNFAPMPMRFRVTAEAATANGGKGRITVEVASPILTAGPLKQEAVVQITN